MLLWLDRYNIHFSTASSILSLRIPPRHLSDLATRIVRGGNNLHEPCRSADYTYQYFVRCTGCPMRWSRPSLDALWQYGDVDSTPQRTNDSHLLDSHLPGMIPRRSRRTLSLDSCYRRRQAFPVRVASGLPANRTFLQQADIFPTGVRVGRTSDCAWSTRRLLVLYRGVKTDEGLKASALRYPSIDQRWEQIAL